MSSITYLYLKKLEKNNKDFINNLFNLSNFNSYPEMMENMTLSVSNYIHKVIF